MLLQDYMDPNIPTKGFFTNVRYMFDLRDVVVDVQGENDGVSGDVTGWTVNQQSETSAARLVQNDIPSAEYATSVSEQDCCPPCCML